MRPALELAEGRTDLGRVRERAHRRAAASSGDIEEAVDLADEVRRESGPQRLAIMEVVQAAAVGSCDPFPCVQMSGSGAAQGHG